MAFLVLDYGLEDMTGAEALDTLEEGGFDRPFVIVTGLGDERVAVEMMKFKGVSLAVSSEALMQGRVPDTDLTRAILNSHNPRRSGDVFVVFEPNWFINDFDGLEVAATHGSPWSYDTFVPVIFAGLDLQPQRIHRGIRTVDVATTLSARVGTKRPSGAAGSVLPEVVR